MDEEVLEYEEAPAGKKYRIGFLGARLLVLVASIFSDFAELFAGCAQDILNHANYKDERDGFREQAARELETIVGPEEG